MPQQSLLYWVIPSELAGMPLPFVHPERRLNQGGVLEAYDDELPTLFRLGIRSVVSLLNIPTDEPVYVSAGFSFLCLPVSGGAAPSLEQAARFTSFVDRERELHRAVAVHCEAGIGRTGTMLAAYLVMKGASAEAAIFQVRTAESTAIETRAQVEFLHQLQGTPQTFRC
jgi:atypical dual specificity phosphatase